MAKEADLKKVELKVFVNCCDGCKRKVKKILQSIEGVLKTEIDPSLPKVTVLGNVDPQIMIRRLLKAGKQAELWSSSTTIQHENQNAAKEKKDIDGAAASNGRKIEIHAAKPECELQAKPPKSGGNTIAIAADKNNGIKDIKIAGGGDAASDHSKTSNKDDHKETAASNISPSNPQVVKSDQNPIPSNPELMGSVKYPSMQDLGNFRTCYQQYCYNVEPPYAIALPYYAMPSCGAHPLPPPAVACYGGQDYLLNYGRPAFQPPFQAPAARVGDYFSDENTVGCHVM